VTTSHCADFSVVPLFDKYTKALCSINHPETVCKTTPVLLTDNQLLHAGDEKQDIPLLATTVQSVLSAAADGGMSSLAMPLIGGGVAGWPAKLAAQVHIAQLHHFVKAATGVSSLKVTMSLSNPC